MQYAQAGRSRVHACTHEHMHKDTVNVKLTALQFGHGWYAFG